MGLVKRWETWVTLAVMVLPLLTVGNPPLVADGSRAHSIVLFLVAALGMAGTVFGQKLTRGRAPQERSTDPAIKLPPDPPSVAAVKIPLDGPK